MEFITTEKSRKLPAAYHSGKEAPSLVFMVPVLLKMYYMHYICSVKSQYM